MMRTQLHCTLGSTCYPKRGKTLDVRIGSRHSIDTALLLDRNSSCCVRAVRAQALLERHGLGRLVVAEAHDVTQLGAVVAVQRSDRGSPGACRGPTCRKEPCPGESQGVERTHLLRLKLCTRHHVANRGRVPLPAARRTDPARVQGLSDLPQ